MAAKEYFPGIAAIKYEGPSSKNPLAFRYYNPDEVVLGKPMKEWLRYSVCYWHTWRGTGSDMFGEGTLLRPWDDATNSLENSLRRVDVHFEFLQKLGVHYFTFHDRDIAPEGATLAETNRNLDAVTVHIKKKMHETGIKLLWGTANLFSHRRYMNGAATNPDAVKKALEVSHELGAENYVFWGGREGYQSLLNTNYRMELDHLAAFLRLAVQHKHAIGFKGQFLIEPKPREPTKHQYDFDAATVIGFLKTYGLEKDFKLNLESNHATLAGHTFHHEMLHASVYGFLGSLDSNTGDQLLGWDVDQFPIDVKETTLAMKVILDQGGLAPGGLNFDAKLRRENLFIAHINGMDTYALGLRNAARLKESGELDHEVKARYHSYESGIGAKIHSGATSFAELEQWILSQGEPKPISAKQEHFEQKLNRAMGI